MTSAYQTRDSMKKSCRFEMPDQETLERNVVTAVQKERARFVNTLTKGNK